MSEERLSFEEDLREVVQVFRQLGFFAAQDALEWEDGRPGFRQVAIGVPMPAWGRLSDEEAAGVLAAWLRSQWGAQDPQVSLANLWDVLGVDVRRVAWIDTKCALPGDRGYEDFVHALARISRGTFQPTDVAEEWSEDETRVIVRFRHGGRQHAFEFPADGSWLDTSLVVRINELLPPEGLRFAALERHAQDLTFLAVTPEEREGGDSLRKGGWSFLPDEALVRNVAKQSGKAFQQEVARRFAGGVTVPAPPTPPSDDTGYV